MTWLTHHSNAAMARENRSSGVCDQVRPKPACSATEVSWSPESLHLNVWILYYLGSEHPRHGRAGRSVALLFAYGINRFSHDLAHIKIKHITCQARNLS